MTSGQATSRLAKSPIGHLVTLPDGHQAYVPAPLPRALSLDTPLVYLLDRASRAVATLAGVGETLPNPHLLIRPFVHREAVLSSRIEGTQASISDVFMFEATGEPRTRFGDAREVVNYVRALEHGLHRLRELPLSVRLVNELHAILLHDVRGRDRTPGQLRTRQVWIGSEGTSIGEARFIPPPPGLVRDLLDDWERFVNEDLELPPLVQCALMHYQFEAIHPYLDGNGRIGRLLITLFLCAKDVLRTPLLYLSAYFERRRDAYYDHLLALSETGDWAAWLRFFLEGVVEQAEDALERCRRLRALQDEFRELTQARRLSANAVRLTERLFANPYVTAPMAAAALGVTYPGARLILERLEHVGVLTSIPDTRPRLYVAAKVLDAIQ
ncbi:MAG TPA: Fic family protein [Dehalococcoidia bacterium]|nr:Fic family protein [Dehalococcoidia bacterium]